MGTNRGTDLYNIWKTVAAVGDDIEIFKSDIMYTSTLNGESLSLYRDLEKTRQEMIKLSKEDENEINELIKDVKLLWMWKYQHTNQWNFTDQQNY